MIFQDRADNTWKITVNDQGIFHFDTQDKMATEKVIFISPEEASEFYGGSDEEKKRFLDKLGSSIGYPLWPLFPTEIFEPELKYMKELGLFGRLKDEEIRQEDLYEFILPFPMDEALKKNPDLKPTLDEVEEYLRQKAQHEEKLKETVICAVEIDRDDLQGEEGGKRMVRASDRIQCCVVCKSPAKSVGAHGAPEDSCVVLHGLCRECTPLDQTEEDKIEAIGEAVSLERDLGKIKKMKE